MLKVIYMHAHETYIYNYFWYILIVLILKLLPWFERVFLHAQKQEDSYNVKRDKLIFKS